MKERVGALDRIMKEVSHDIKLPKMHKMTEGNNDFDEELQKGIKCEMEEHGMSDAEAERTAKEHIQEDPEYYSKLEGMEEGEHNEDTETPGEEYSESPEVQAEEEENGEEKPMKHMSISELGRGKLATKPRGNPNFKKRF